MKIIEHNFTKTVWREDVMLRRETIAKQQQTFLSSIETGKPKFYQNCKLHKKMVKTWAKS